jgi:integrase
MQAIARKSLRPPTWARLIGNPPSGELSRIIRLLGLLWKAVVDDLDLHRSVDEFIGHLKGVLKRKNGTINRKIELVKQALRHAKFPVPDVPKLPENNARQGFFEKAEFEAVESKLDQPFRDLARLGYLTGWREGEIRSLRWEWIDRKAGELALPDSKNGKPRKIAIDEALAEIIERRWQARRFETLSGGKAISPLVFHVDGDPVLARRLQKAWKKATTDAELPHKLFHDLRRTAVRDMVRAGVSTTVAKKISGHRTDSMFERYNIVATADTLEALRLRRALLEATPAEGNLTPLRPQKADNSRTESA